MGDYVKFVGKAQRYLEKNPEMRDVYSIRSLAKYWACKYDNPNYSRYLWRDWEPK